MIPVAVTALEWTGMVLLYLFLAVAYALWLEWFVDYGPIGRRIAALEAAREEGA